MRTVLFVCTGNYYRSRYAELRFNALVPSTLGWRADSRGFALTASNVGPISRHVVERLSALGLAGPEAPRDPQTLVEADLATADLVIALDEVEHLPYVERLFPHWRDRMVFWRVADTHAMTVADALASLDTHVDDLITQLGHPEG